MDNISYEELKDTLQVYFTDYTRFNLTLQNYPANTLKEFLDLRYVKEDIINCTNIRFNTVGGVNILLPSHIVSILFSRTKNCKFLYFPNSIKRITINGFEKYSAFATPMYNLPDLPRNLLYLICSNSGLNNIPPLPETLKLLDCSGNNNISKLPELPKGLIILNCKETTITQLPELPEGLIELVFGGGGKEHALYLPEKFPINLEVLEIGSDKCFFTSSWESDIREDPEGEIELEDDEPVMTPEIINDYIENKKNESDYYFTNFINPESFTEFPPNLKKLYIRGTNLSSFPDKLPAIWNTATTEEFVTEKPNTNISDLNPDPIVKVVNFSLNVSLSQINFDNQKYLPLLENIKSLIKKHNILPNYIGSGGVFVTGTGYKLDDLINKLQSENHASFNTSMGNRGILTTIPKDNNNTANSNINTNISLPISLNPRISEYLSSNQELQNKTIDNSKGGKYKKTKRMKNIKRKFSRKSTFSKVLRS